MSRRPFLLLALSGLLFLSPGVAGESTTTTCYGGSTESSVIWVDPPPLGSGGGLGDVARHYLSLRDASIWQEDNGRQGLQRTARICHVQTYDDNGVLLKSEPYIEYGRDSFIGP